MCGITPLVYHTYSSHLFMWFFGCIEYKYIPSNHTKPCVYFSTNHTHTRTHKQMESPTHIFWFLWIKVSKSTECVNFVWLIVIKCLKIIIFHLINHTHSVNKVYCRLKECNRVSACVGVCVCVCVRAVCVCVCVCVCSRNI